MCKRVPLLASSQGGFILPMVLLLLAFGAILLIPTTQFAWASLKANQVTEWKASELFDADAGVEELGGFLQQHTIHVGLSEIL